MRDGFYVRAVNTFGFVGIGGSNADGLSGFGTESLAAIGTSLTRGLALALNLQTAQRIGTFKRGPYQGIKFRSGGDELELSQKVTVASAKIGALVDWYPLPQYGFHLGVSGGISFTSMTLHADDTILAGVSPYGALLIGYDWPISRTIAFGLALMGSAAGSTELKYDGKTKSGYEFSTQSIGIGASFLYF